MNLGLINNVTKLLPLVGVVMSLVEKSYKIGIQKRKNFIELVLQGLTTYFPPQLINDPVFAEKLGRLADLVVEISNYIDNVRKKDNEDS